jgi:hypothetical protein
VLEVAAKLRGHPFDQEVEGDRRAVMNLQKQDGGEITNQPMDVRMQGRALEQSGVEGEMRTLAPRRQDSRERRQQRA